MPPKVAAITMAYNEAALLPVWARHYARQVGADHCYVVDHGSTDPIVLPPGMNVLRLPRSAHDDQRRAGFISRLAGSLLGYFDWVLYTDVDELVVADPAAFRNLPEYCATVSGCDTVTAIGFDVQHVSPSEAPLATDRPVGGQRGWVRFTSAMCKPVLTRRPLAWSPGFHTCDQPLVFDRLYLFHLHWADRTLGLQRLARTRSMAWANSCFGGHQRVADREWQSLFDGMERLPQKPCIPFDPGQPPLKDWLMRTQASRKQGGGEPIGLDLGLNAAELWPIPGAFRARF